MYSFFNFINLLKLTVKNFSYFKTQLRFNFKYTRHVFLSFHMRKYEFKGFSKETFFSYEKQLINSVIPSKQYTVDFKNITRTNNTFTFSICDYSIDLLNGKYLYLFIFNDLERGFEIFIFKIENQRGDYLNCKLVDFSGMLNYCTRFNLKHFKFYQYRRKSTDDLQILREDRFFTWENNLLKIFTYFFRKYLKPKQKIKQFNFDEVFEREIDFDF